MPVAELSAHVVDYLQHAPTSEFHGQPVEIVQHWQGHENLLWHVAVGAGDPQHATVKLFMDAGQARGRRQFDGQATFAEYGIAPAAFWFDRYPQGLARQMLVYQWVAGTAPDLQDASVLDGVMQTVATVHSAPADTVRRFCPHPVNLDYFWRVESGALNAALQRSQNPSAPVPTPTLTKCLDALAGGAEALVTGALPLWQGAAPTPVHGDLSPENLLQEPRGTLCLLDWEMYGLGDPALDMGRLIFNLRGEIDAKRASNSLERYLAQVDQPGLAQRVTTYTQLLPVQAVAYLLNGVAHTLGQDEQPGTRAQIRDTLPFLASALEAALLAAGHAVDVPICTDHAPTATAEWQALIAHTLDAGKE